MESGSPFLPVYGSRADLSDEASRKVRLADMNNDGRDDIFQFTEAGTGYRWLSTGSGYGSSAVIGSGFGKP